MENRTNPIEVLKNSTIDLVKICLYAAAKLAAETLLIWWMLGEIGHPYTFKEIFFGLVIVRLATGQSRIVDNGKKTENNVKSTGKQKQHIGRD